MTDATTFILIAGLAFFFFLAPSKNFKQAFQALAFVLFIGLAIMTLGSDELVVTEYEFIHMPPEYETFVMDFRNKAHINNWDITFSDEYGTPITSQVVGKETNPLEITRKSNKFHLKTTADFSQTTTPVTVDYTTFTLSKEIPDKITKVKINASFNPAPYTKGTQNIPDVKYDFRDNKRGSLPYSSFCIKPAINANCIEDKLIPISLEYGLIGTLHYDVPTDSSYLFIQGTSFNIYDQDQNTRIFGIPADTEIFTINSITYTYETKPAGMSKEPLEFILINFGDMNIAIAMIFIFLAVINLMIFMIDVVTWKRKTNSKTL